MVYQNPSIDFTYKTETTRDEAWWVGLALIFAIYAYSEYSKNQAITDCGRRGGLAKVESSLFGLSWKVSCYKK